MSFEKTILILAAPPDATVFESAIEAHTCAPRRVHSIQHLLTELRSSATGVTGVIIRASAIASAELRSICESVVHATRGSVILVVDEPASGGFNAPPGVLVKCVNGPIAPDDAMAIVDLVFHGSCLLESSVVGAAEAQPFSATSTWGRRILRLLDRVAESDIPVLIMGETGTGKEVLARAIHARSRRHKEAFLKLNCAALPSELIESELFGYERGAFTGAFKTTPGKFELAEGGTLLLDEIGDMDPNLQAKLLHVLQDAKFLKLGGKEHVSINVRIIAATHRDLESAVLSGRFREDLYYRLNVISLTIPPLRERVDEILPLAHAFLARYVSEEDSVPELSPAMQRSLLGYHWPGNIRELENKIRKFLVLRQPEILTTDLYRPAGRGAQRDSSIGKAGPASQRTDSTALLQNAGMDVDIERRQHEIEDLDDTSLEHAHDALSRVRESHRKAEAETILNVLNATMWNRKATAQILHIDYKALLYKMKKLGLSQAAITRAIFDSRTTQSGPVHGTVSDECASAGRHALSP